MTIGVDLDSVLAYLEQPLLDFHNQKFKTNHQIEDIKNYDLSLLWNCTRDEMIDIIFEFYRSPFMDKVVPVENSVEEVAKLSLKHDLVVITSRALWIEDITTDWINKYFPNMFKKIVQTNQFSKADENKKKKSDICSMLNVSILIDDGPEYCEDCAQAGFKVYLYDRPWNTDIELHKNVTRVFGWKDISKRLL